MIHDDAPHPSLIYDFERRGERRRLQRLNWGKVITIREAFLSECIIANLTSKGACLRIMQEVHIPDYFLLYIDVSGAVLEGGVIWRHGYELGCKFADAPYIATSALSRRMRAKYYGI